MKSRFQHMQRRFSETIGRMCFGAWNSRFYQRNCHFEAPGAPALHAGGVFLCAPTVGVSMRSDQTSRIALGTAPPYSRAKSPNVTLSVRSAAPICTSTVFGEIFMTCAISA